MRKLAALGMLLCLTACGCGGQSAPRYEVRTLASGKPLKVLGVGTLNFPQGGPALMLKYVSDVGLDDRTALSKEADEIWAGFQSEAEKAGVGSVILSANSPPGGGIIQHGRAFNFVYQKDSTGAWRRLADES